MNVPSIKRAVRSVLPDPVYRKYRQRKIARQIAAYKPRIVEHTYAGKHLRISLRDPLAEGWYDRDWPVPSELAIAIDSVDLEGALAFDLGAHQGVVALILSKLVGQHGRVIAVEAEPHNALVAKEN